MDKNNKIKIVGAAVFFPVLVGFSFLGVKICIPLANSLQILVHRYNFALLALLLLMAFGIVKINLKGRSKKNLMLTAGCYIGFMALQVVGLCFSTSIEASVIFAAIPILVQIIASIFLGEKATVKQNIFVCLSVAALILMLVLGSTSITFHPAGVILLLLSSVSMAVSNVFMRYVREEYRPVEISAAIITGGFAVFNFAFLVYGMATGNLHTYFEPFQYPEFIAAAAYLGIGCILLSAQLMSWLLSKIKAVKASVLGNVSTAISILAGSLILGEALMPYHIFCTVLMMVGVVGLSLSGEEGKHEISVSDGK